MDLLEYQAKGLFREVGIPVLPSQRIDQAQDLKGLRIPYPVVLKSQVRAGGRGKAGGIRFVENTIDAVAAAQAIFNLPIMGEYPQVLLAEAKYNASQELYLAVTLDPQSRRPILLGALQGGESMSDTGIDQVKQVVVDQDFSPFHARHLVVNMGLSGESLLKVSTLVEKMYRLFVDKDLDLIEINPLGISPTGEVMALDGKVIVNSGALSRHPDLIQVIDTCHREVEAKLRETSDSRLEGQAELLSSDRTLTCAVNFVEPDGNIGILCNGSGLTLATVDGIIQAKGKPALFLNFGEEDYFQMTDILRQQLRRSLEMISQARGVKVVLVNFLGHLGNIREIGLEIASYLQHGIVLGQTPHYVLRLADQSTEGLKADFAELPVEITDSLESAIAAAIASVK